MKVLVVRIEKGSGMEHTRAQEEPEELHGDRADVVVWRPRVVTNSEMCTRRAVLFEPERAQPAVQPCVLAQLPFVQPVVLEHHKVRCPQHLVQRAHCFLRHPAATATANTAYGQRANSAPYPRAQPSKLHEPSM